MRGSCPYAGVVATDFLAFNMTPTAAETALDLEMKFRNRSPKHVEGLHLRRGKPQCLAAILLATLPTVSALRS